MNHLSSFYCHILPCLTFSSRLSVYLFAALTVRYLTGRFIGEYRSNTDLLYNKTITLETGLTEVDIVDVYAGSVDGDEQNEFPMEQVSSQNYEKKNNYFYSFQINL